MKKTKLLQLNNHMLVKMELNNISVSHKFRAAQYIINDAIKKGLIDNQTTIIEKTGGNFGFGLLAACLKQNIPVELAIGLSFSQRKKQQLKKLGAILIGQDMLEKGKSPKEVVEWHLENQQQLGKKYFYTDQFNNKGSYFAHLETGQEIAQQLKIQAPDTKEIIFVGCAGTGASFSGISDALKQHGYQLKTILVEPQGCNSKQNIFQNHNMEGMSVGVNPPFLKWDQVDEIHYVADDELDDIKQDIFKQHGILVGNTSAACYKVAYQFDQKVHNKCKVLSFFYDSGIWYQ